MDATYLKINCPVCDTQNTNLLDYDNLNNSNDNDWDSIYTELKRLEKAIRKRNIFLEEQDLGRAKSLDDHQRQ